MVIDDDDHDLAMMKRCLLKSKLDIDLIMFNDSIEAQEYLSLNNPPLALFFLIYICLKSQENSF